MTAGAVLRELRAWLDEHPEYRGVAERCPRALRRCVEAWLRAGMEQARVVRRAKLLIWRLHWIEEALWFSEWRTMHPLEIKRRYEAAAKVAAHMPELGLAVQPPPGTFKLANVGTRGAAARERYVRNGKLLDCGAWAGVFAREFDEVVPKRAVARYEVIAELIRAIGIPKVTGKNVRTILVHPSRAPGAQVIDFLAARARRRQIT
ncbi:MAG TPA: hypothetical protein VF203_15090 [Burkholderiales bacterium]